jgi:peptidoglycan/LPS O-acetylase OafA/YrhL
MLFFLISGFVICLSTEQQRPDFAAYFGRRWRRIYPIFLLALCLSTVDIVFLKAQPFPWHDFWGNLFMLQDFTHGKPGTWFPAFGGNFPLWSLSYEWWFYLLFYPIWRYASLMWRRAIAAGTSFLGLITYALHPNQPCLYLTYFILWWTGAEFAQQYLAEGRVTFKGQRVPVAILAGFAGLVTVVLLAAHNWTGRLGFGDYPILQIRHFSACLVIALGALVWQKFNCTGFEAIFGIFKYAAPISYGIYALHCPIGVNGAFFSFLQPGVVKLFATTVTVFIVAWFAEIPYQKYMNRLASLSAGRVSFFLSHGQNLRAGRD